MYHLGTDKGPVSGPVRTERCLTSSHQHLQHRFEAWTGQSTGPVKRGTDASNICVSLVVIVCWITSRVPAVSLRRNWTNAYITYQSLLPESLSWAWSFDTYRWVSQKKNIPKRNIFTGIRTQNSFLPAETNKFVLGSVFLSCLVTQTVTRTQDRFSGLWPLYYHLLFETNNLILAPFFYRA
jgi:hypothetical protein